MKKLVVLICLAFIGFSATAQNTDSAYKQKVIKLMKMRSGDFAAMKTVIDKVSMNIPEKNKAAFNKEVNAKLDELYGKMADAYMKIYTKKETEAMLDFYNSPMGKEIQKKLPQYLEKSKKIGQDFGQQELVPLMQKYMAQ